MKKKNKWNKLDKREYKIGRFRVSTKVFGYAKLRAIIPKVPKTTYFSTFFALFFGNFFVKLF